jgi:hypothetical protein
LSTSGTEEYGVKHLLQDLECMSLLRALHDDYPNVVTNLLLSKTLSIKDVTDACEGLDNLRTDSSATAMTTRISSSPPTTLCTWCSRPGHLEQNCFKEASMKRYREAVKKRMEGGKSTKEEVASKASVDPSSPILYHWNPDTGASSHMTPHRHWFKSYYPYVIPIWLADDHIIHSAGKGVVVFVPEGHDREIWFYDVLHVPLLRNNLLSPFHLTLHKGYCVILEGSKALFYHSEACRFTATISNGVGRLDGYTR